MDESPETSRSVHPNSLDFEQLSLEAKRRWLFPAEICEILRNNETLRISSEPSNKPPSGSLLLFDRNVTRYFRKDGHNWPRKEDGKLANEAHKKLKAGSIDVLNCYYARGEENKNFQRRCYSMLEEDFSHIVLVHYLELTGKSEDIDRVKEAQVACPYSQGQESEEIMSNSKIDSSRCPGSHPNDCQVLSVSEYTNTPLLPDGGHALEHGNAQSEYNYQAISGFHFGLDSPQLAAEQIHAEDSFCESLPIIFGIESDPFQLNRSNSDMHAELAQPTDDCFWTSHEYTTCKDDGKCFTPCESMELESLSSFGWHSQIQEKSKLHLAMIGL